MFLMFSYVRCCWNRFQLSWMLLLLRGCFCVRWWFRRGRVWFDWMGRGYGWWSSLVYGSGCIGSCLFTGSSCGACRLSYLLILMIKLSLYIQSHSLARNITSLYWSECTTNQDNNKIVLEDSTVVSNIISIIYSNNIVRPYYNITNHRISSL